MVAGYLGRLSSWEERTGEVGYSLQALGGRRRIHFLLVPPDNPLSSITYTYSPTPDLGPLVEC